MSLKGVLHRIAWVDLGNRAVTIEQPADELYAAYLGGYGLGAYYLYTRQPANTDPLAPESILGFLTGPLTGTPAVAGNRFVAVAKSPKTGGWGDANCGGRFGPALKQAGLDALFFTGEAETPVYVLVENGTVTIHDAHDLWGMGCGAVEERFQLQYGKNAHAAVIGQAGGLEPNVLMGDAPVKNWAQDVLIISPAAPVSAGRRCLPTKPRDMDAGGARWPAAPGLPFHPAPLLHGGSAPNMKPWQLSAPCALTTIRSQYAWPMPCAMKPALTPFQQAPR